MSATTETDTRPADTGADEDDLQVHYAKRADIVRAIVEGGLITALCGKKFPPRREPDPHDPVCQTCVYLLELLPE